jgi:cytochrome P450
MGQVTSFTSISPSTAILGVLISFVLYGAFKAFSIVFRRTELRNIPGPQKGHVIFGNMQPIFKAGPSEQHARWQKEFGDVYVYHNFFNVCYLIAILQNSADVGWFI